MFVGVPVMLTEFVVLAERASPAGKLPLATFHEKGPAPPVEVTAALYAPWVLPEGRVVVVMVSAFRAAGVPEQPMARKHARTGMNAARNRPCGRAIILIVASRYTQVLESLPTSFKPQNPFSRPKNDRVLWRIRQRNGAKKSGNPSTFWEYQSLFGAYGGSEPSSSAVFR